MIDIWNDGGEFNDLLQKQILKALEEYVGNGRLYLDPKSLTVKFEIGFDCDVLVDKKIGLANMFENELAYHVRGSKAVDLLTFKFDAGPNVEKLQRCLRILRET